ncbi:MAG: uroporphyrinogen-III C-methyltransferase [Ilumatobacteraceae bacterium]
MSDEMPQPMRPYRVDLDHGPWAALVGAGPGDPGLLTRRAAELLGAADVVLHDWLSGPEILQLARPDASLVDVGKGKGRGSSQRHIEQLLVAHHGEGSRVVRLKGGDPFLFGRGMEEVRAAHAAGFDVEVVPGVSSALAAPALAGIAVTERTVSAQVTVVSGHRVDGDNEWATLARLSGTLVVLMAATTGAAVAAELVAGGMQATTPVAVVVDASGTGQAALHTDLGRLAARREPLPGPCVLVIGAVAAGGAVGTDRSPHVAAPVAV